jgi:hypothetical protein
MAAKKMYWRIVGYQSTEAIFESELPYGLFTDKQMSNLVRVLTAKAGLTFNEIIDSYVSRNTKRYRSLLEVQIQGKPKFCLTCGSNPHFVASVVEK